VKRKRLKDLAQVVSGGTPKTSVANYWNGYIPWATPADLSRIVGPYISETPRQLTDDGLKACSARVMPAGSVLLSSRAPIGHVAINTQPMATNQGFKSLIPGDQLDAKYLYYWLKANRAYLESLGNGATFKEIGKRTVENIEIPVPHVNEQRRIATILDKADAIRIKRREMVSYLDALEQSIFESMFKADSQHQTLDDVVDIKSGSTPSKANVDFWGGDMPWFSPKDIKASNLYDSLDHVTDKALEKTSLKKLPVNTPVVVVRGMILAHSAPTAVLRTPATINQDLKALIPKNGIDVDFLAAAIRARKKWLLQRVATSAHGTKRIETRVLRELPIPKVGQSQQIAFSHATACVKRMRRSLNSQLDSSDYLLASLQSRAFSGQL